MLDLPTAERYARVGLANTGREYPHHLTHLLAGPDDLRTPRVLHPVFYGSYDWHSAVHQHWMLVRLVRSVPDLPSAAAVTSALDARLTAAGVEQEAAYCDAPQRRAFERPYGWAWLLALHAECASWAERDPGAPAGRWATHLAPLAALLRGRMLIWLATRYPQRSGSHANSAFAAGLAHDAATASGDEVLAAAADAAARRWYAADAAYPAGLEPSATDFLSPALAAADLMTRVLDPDGFAGWFERFLPDPAPLEQPALVLDRSDPQFVHLDGLNLSRAWCWRRIAAHLPVGDSRRERFAAAAQRHAQASLAHASGGDYVGEHWLPTFAVVWLSGAPGSPATP